MANENIKPQAMKILQPLVDKEIYQPKVTGKTLYDLVEYAKKMELEVTAMYDIAAIKMAAIDQITYQHLLQFVRIQADARKFYIDACSVLDGLDKNGEILSQTLIFK